MRRVGFLLLMIGLLATPINASLAVDPPICPNGQYGDGKGGCTTTPPQMPPGAPGAPVCPPGTPAGQPCPVGTPSSPAMGSGFKSAYPIDRTPSAFVNANPGQKTSTNTSSEWLGVGFDSSARVQFLPYASVENNLAGGARDTHLCLPDLSDPTCAPSAGWSFAHGESGIGNCAQNPNTACVESFVIIKADGSEIKASPLQQFPKDFKNQPGWKSPNNDGSGYPALLASWIWRAEGDAPGSEHDYYLSGNVSWGATADKSRSSSWSPSVNEFFMEVAPIVRENSSLIKAPSRTEITNVLGSGKVISFSNSEEGCLANDTGVCLHRRDFPEGLRYRLTLQMPRNIAAWLNGRLDRPTASVEKLSSTSERITVEAAPAENIFGGSWVKYSSIPSSFFTSFAQPNPFQTIASKTNNMMILDSGQDKSLEYYKAWAPYLGEKAYSINKTWTLSNVRVSPTSTCVKQGEGLQGIVATNASAYDAAAPTYDSTSGTLDYHVAAPHFKADGVTPNVGSYGLTMSASLLQCMYGISSVPSEASIAITDSDGKQTIQTVALGQQNGWVHLNANNFSFSSPTLKIKLNQAQAATPVTQPATTTPATTTPATTPAISATAATKKSTITCVKGKTTKKVTGTKPTCPAGYKKK